MKKICLVSLGCAKNLVDSEIILAAFKNNNYLITINPKESDIILINTCGFIKEARNEAYSTIEEMLRYRKKLIVTGCLPSLYLDELKKKFPEIDLIIPFNKYNHFEEILSSYLKDNKKYCFNPFSRIIATNANFAYVRIADGCNNFCSFCTIPFIRGRYKSRTISDIKKEVEELVESGVKEITLIAQDTSLYGLDLKDGSNITKLLLNLEKIKNLKHIRLLYLYPNEITDEFISFIKVSKKTYPYFDIPLQHADEKILKLMNRKDTHQNNVKLLNKIRKQIPNAIFRTTFIVGFPFEGNKEFKKLLNFVKDFEFDHVGVFSYSKEKFTKAYSMSNQVSEEIKEKRRINLLEVQKKVSYKKNLSHIGEVIDGLYLGEEPSSNNKCFLTKYNAPEGIDGNVYSRSDKKLIVGKFYKLKIIDAFAYDLVTKILN